jgi:glycosyltransferase involved in cell wall biosynthesis
VLLQLHGGAFDTWYESHGRLAKTAIRLGMRSASEVVVLSEYWKRLVNALLPGKRIHVVPNGVEIANASRATHSKGRDLVAVTIGTVGQRKGHFDIVRAAAELGDVPLRFAFGGPDETAETGRQLRALIDSLGVTERIELRGALDSAEKWRSLAEADLFLLPSHGENMPNSVLEAMAAELAIICSPVGAVPEMVEADSGALYVPAGDHRAIAAAIRRLLANPELRRAMGTYNRQAVESRFAFERIAERLDRLYRAEDGERTSRRGPAESTEGA